MQCILYLINILEGTVLYIIFLDLFKSVVLFALIMCLSFFFFFFKRSESLCQLPCEYKTSKGQVSPFLCLSLPMLLDFESFAINRGGIPDITSPREWVRDIWGTWFDEVFPPLENVQSTGSLPAGLEENRLPQDNFQDLDKVDVSEVLDEGLTIANVKLEVAKLTQTLTELGNHCAFDLCRRGALYIKLGYLNQALEDLNAVRLFFCFAFY